MKDKDEITKKRLEIDAIRRVEKEADLDPFTRGQLAGAQQALYWMLEVGMDPIRAILSDSQMASIEAAEQDVAPDGAVGEVLTTENKKWKDEAIWYGEE